MGGISLLKRRTTHCIILCIITLLFLPLQIIHANKENATKENYRILFISSYSYSWGPIPNQINGILKSLPSSQYTVNYEFMDTKNTNYNENYSEFHDFLKYKLASRLPYDGVIVGDDAALQFIMLYKDELFPNTPIVFEGIDHIENAKIAAEDPLITGVVENVDYVTNLKLARSLFPTATRLVFIYDNMENGVGIANQLMRASNLWDDYEVEYLNTSDYTKGEFSRKLENLDAKSIVFGISIGEQKGNIVYTEDERYTIIRNHARTPIFSITQSGVGSGMLGGYIINHEANGQLAGSMMKKILEENIVPEIELTTPSTYYFDYNVMENFDIRPLALPKESEIINKPQSFFEKYAFWITNILAVGLIISIIAYFIRRKANMRLTVAYNQLLNAEAHLKEQFAHNKKHTAALEIQEKQIRYQAEHDYLTNLPNRRAAMAHLDLLFQEHVDFTVIIIDLDDFKDMNDTYSHTYGDAILKTLANRFLEKIANDYIYVSRFGGDEFLLIVKEIELNEISKVLTQITSIFSQPIISDGIEQYIKTSIGIANSKDSFEKTDDIIANVDLALHEAKKSGKNTIVYYHPKMREALLQTKEIKQILSVACEQDGFYLLYQPQIEAGTGRVHSYEALIRLKDHAISPAQFIPIAEETELILKMGRIVATKVVEQLVNWREQGLDLLPVAINFSSKQIKDNEFVPFLKDLLDEYNISPKLIEIEFTESIFIDNSDEAANLFNDFLSIGVNLALDDFGTGYSSISYLTYIPVKKIKLDKSFVDIYLQDGKDEFIQNIIQLSHSLNLKITVEGVEEHHQYERLKQFKCDYIQGYYFSKPILGKDVLH